MEQISLGQEFLVQLTAHQWRLEGYVRNLVLNRADADEILQETNLYLCQHSQDFEPGTEFIAWMLRVAYFRVLDWRKRQTRSKLVFDDDLLSTVAIEAQCSDAHTEIRRQALKACLEKLTPRERGLIEDLYSDLAVTPQSLAVRAGRSVNAIYISLHRIRLRLFECVRRTLAATERSL